MAIFQKLLNLDEEIEKSKITPIIVNDLPNDTELDLEDLSRKITTQYFGDKISMLPSCQCGYLRMTSLTGEICPSCHTPVQSSIENDIQSLMWFRCPEGIHTLMSPIVFTMLYRRFANKGWNIIQWLIDPSYKPNVRMTALMAHLTNSGVQRGWNYFVQNFDAIFQLLMSFKDFKVGKGEIDYLQYLYEKERSKFFCRYLPIPNRMMFVFENTNKGIWLSSSTDKATKYVSLMLSIDRSLQPLSIRAKEARIAKLYTMLAEYTQDYIVNDLSKKVSQIRKHVIATKTIMSFRVVAISISKPADYECIEVPWYVALMTFRPMIMNKLVKYGFSVNNAANLILSHVGIWHPLLDKVLTELIEEAPGKRIYALFHRNPTLKPGASQRAYIRFKRDPADKTVGIPIPTVRAPNLDFDGLFWTSIHY